MKNSDLSLTALVYNAHVNQLSYKAGKAKYSKSIQTLLNKCYTDATIIAAPSKLATLANGHKVDEYTVQIPENCSRLQKLFNVPVKVYYNEEAREQEKLMAKSERKVSLSTDKIDGKELVLLNPDEYKAACEVLTTGQFPITLTTVAISKERQTYAKNVAVIQQVESSKLHAYKVGMSASGEGENSYDTITCKAMYFRAQSDVSELFAEVFDYPLTTVWTLITGRDWEDSVSGRNPFSGLTIKGKDVTIQDEA